MEITEEDQDKLHVQIEDEQGTEQSVIIGIKSVEVESDEEE